MDSTVDVAAIEAALNAATPGAWYEFDDCGTWVVRVDEESCHFLEVCQAGDRLTTNQADAYLIANAPTWLRQCVARIKHLEQQCDVVGDAKARIEALSDRCDELAGECVVSAARIQCEVQRAEAEVEQLREEVAKRDDAGKQLMAKNTELEAIAHQWEEEQEKAWQGKLRAETELRDLKAEVERLRKKNTELNRRATKAEAHVNTTIENCRRQGVSLGRSLANAGYTSLKERAERAEAERDELNNLLFELDQTYGAHWQDDPAFKPQIDAALAAKEDQ